MKCVGRLSGGCGEAVYMVWVRCLKSMGMLWGGSGEAI